MKRAMIAMSGGVDSSVAALLMKQASYDCMGITMRLYRNPGMEQSSQKSCCSDADEEDAAYVCWQLGIPFESLCCTREFEEAVIQDFIREYESGRTPNPCIKELFMSFSNHDHGFGGQLLIALSLKFVGG